jgi:hypothetical protein
VDDPDGTYDPNAAEPFAKEEFQFLRRRRADAPQKGERPGKPEFAENIFRFDEAFAFPKP